MPDQTTVSGHSPHSHPRGFAPAKPVQMPTLMLVEDSRYASEVMRLYARVLGLRLRRAADLETAGGHLRLYQPDIVVIDLGLPDGRGEGLIDKLSHAQPRPPLIIATSGQGHLRAGALAAGADVFIEKPMPDIATFRALLIDNFPGPLPLLMMQSPAPSPRPDHMALKDDLNLAAQELAQELARDGATDLREQRHTTTRTRYIAGLLDGIAGSLGDRALQSAARNQLCAQGDGASAQGFRRLRDLVNERLRDVSELRGI
ncbi:MAG: response regulator [Cypionkella sp.]|nr:response regulator [Cypionkella sp.]